MILSSTRDAFILEAFLKRLSRRELSGKRISSIEQNAVASYVVQEHCVPGLHGPLGEQHIDLTRGIKVQRARIDSGDRPSCPSRNTQADTRQLQLCSSSVPPNSSSSNSSSSS